MLQVFWDLVYDVSVYVAFKLSGKFTHNFFLFPKTDIQFLFYFSVRLVYDLASQTVLICRLSAYTSHNLL